MRHGCRGPAVALLAVTLAATACGSGGSSAPTTSATPVSTAAVTTAAVTTTTTTSRAPAPSTTLATDASGLAATLEQYRSSVVEHRLEIQFVHRGSRAVSLTDVRLVWPGLTPVAPAADPLLVSPGQIVDRTVGYGEAVCADPPTGDERTPSAPAVAEAVATWPDTGETAPVRIPVTDVRGILARVYEPDCRRQGLTAAVTPTWSPELIEMTLPDGRAALAGAFRLDRPAGADPSTAVRVTALSGSVLLAVTPTEDAGPTLLTLAAGQASAVLPVVFSQSGNCAPHALAESKQTFLLGVTFVVGDRPEVVVDVVPDAASKDRLTAMINRACGVG